MNDELQKIFRSLIQDDCRFYDAITNEFLGVVRPVSLTQNHHCSKEQFWVGLLHNSHDKVKEIRVRRDKMPEIFFVRS